MTRVRRDEFSSLGQSFSVDLHRPADNVRTALADADIDLAELGNIGDGDSVIRGTTEFAQLYDRLAELDRTRPVTTPGSLDRASRFFASLTRQTEPRPEQQRTQAIGVGARRRVDGDAPSPRAPGHTADPTAVRADRTADPAAVDPNAAPRMTDYRAVRTGTGRGARDVRARSAIPAEVDASLAHMRSAPQPETRRGGPQSAAAYLRTLDAYETRGMRNHGRVPEGVPAALWPETRALAMQNISADDARHFMATGRLPDLVGEDGQVVRSGDDRFQDLQNAAARQGEWTAVNSLTFLVEGRRAALRVDRAELETSLAALPPASTERAALTEEIRRLGEIDRTLARGLQGVYSAATHARERTASALITRAARLDQQALEARASGRGNADQLERRATELRDRGARMAHSEATYRAAMPRSGYDASRTFALAAEAQIARGRSEVIAQGRRTGALPESVPASLGNAEDAGNGVPGAERELANARSTDRSGGRSDQRLLALEGTRQGTVALFHRQHLERGGYFGGPNGAAPVRTPTLVQHRRDYVDARVAQGTVAGQRLERYGDPARLSGADAIEASRVAAERRGVTEELTGTLGTSLASEAAARDARTQRDQLGTALTAARTEEREANAALPASQEASDRANSANSPIIDARSSSEARRDRQAVADARTIVGADRDRAALAAGRRRSLETAVGTADGNVRTAEARAERDRADAEIVRTALGRTPALIPGGTGTAEAAYRSGRAEGDRLATRGASYLDRAESQLPRREGARRQGQLEIAGARLDLASYWTRSTEMNARALGEPGREGATTRLDRSAALIDRADATRRDLPADHRSRPLLASSIVDARVELAEANSEYRPGVSRDQLATAETLAGTDLASRPDLQTAARGRIGIGAINSLARHDLRFDQVLRGGGHDATADDALYAQAHRMLDGTGAGQTREVEAARALLGRVDDGLRAVDGMFGVSGTQLRNGQAYSEAQTRAMGRSEIQAAQAQVSTVISGLTYVVTIGNVDMHEMQAEAGESATNMRLGFSRNQTGTLVNGRDQLAAAWSTARSEGRQFEMLGAIRIFGNSENRRAAGDQLAGNAFMFIDSRVPASLQSGERRRPNDWQDFMRVAIRGYRSHDGHQMNDIPPAVPVARALTGSVLGYRQAMDNLGDSRIGVLTESMQDMMRDQGASLRDTTRNMGVIIALNCGLEVALGIVLTGGIGSAGAVAEAGNAANAARTGVQALNAARNMGMVARAGQALNAFRVAHPVLHTMGVGLTVGAGMMGASHGVRRVFGESSSVARGFDVAVNFIPIGAANRAAGLAGAARRTAVGADQAIVQGERAVGRMAQLRQAVSGERLLAHARFYGPQIALGGGQAFVTSLATPAISQRLGIRSEVGQAAVGLALNTLMSGGVAAGMAHVNRHAASAERIAGHMLEPGADATRARAVRAEVESFLRRTEGRVPTEAETSALRRSMYERLGIPENAADRRAQVDSTIEALRIQRAGELGTSGRRGPITAEDAPAIVDRVAERLYEARGGERGGASRAQAYRDAALFVAESPGVDGAARIRLQDAAIDRARAAELAQGFSVAGEGQARAVLRTPQQRQRAEAILAAEIPGMRRSLEEGRTLTDASNGPSQFQRLSERLQREVGLTREGAESLLRGVQHDLVERGVTSRLYAEQSRTGMPLSEARVREVAADVAQRSGMSREDAGSLGANVAQAEGVREWLNGVSLNRWNAMNPAQRQQAYLQMFPQASALSALTPAQFQAAFGNGPYTHNVLLLANAPGFAAFAQAHPADARALYDVSHAFDPYTVATAVQGGNFQGALNVLRSLAPQVTPVSVPIAGGAPVAYRRVEAPAASQLHPALRLAPTMSLDHNGAFANQAQIPGVVRSGQARHTPVSERDWLHLNPAQIELPIPGGGSRRATGADWARIAVFSGHGSPTGFEGLTTPQAAQLMAQQIVAYNRANAGSRPALEYVLLNACSQGDRSGFLGLRGETNAAVFQREVNAQLQAMGHGPVTVLAARDAGVTYGSAWQHDFWGRSYDATYVDPSNQRRNLSPSTIRTMLLFGGIGAGYAAGGAAIYSIVSDRREQERQRTQQPRVEPQPREARP